jgi:predicted Zn-dependent protease
MEQEFRLGRLATALVLSRGAGAVLPPAHPYSRYVQRVGGLLALAAAERRTDDDRPAPYGGWRFLVRLADETRIAGIAGGFVIVPTGALRAAATEDELAAGLALAVAHVQLGHALQPAVEARPAPGAPTPLEPAVKALADRTQQPYDPALEQAARARAQALLDDAGYRVPDEGVVVAEAPARPDASGRERRFERETAALRAPYIAPPPVDTRSGRMREGRSR